MMSRGSRQAKSRMVGIRRLSTRLNGRRDLPRCTTHPRTHASLQSGARGIHSVDQAARRTEFTASGGRPTMWAISGTL